MRFHTFCFTALIALILSITTVTTGCTGPAKPATVEIAAYSTIQQTDQAVLTALSVWANRYAKREAANEETKQSDPGGYLDRRNALLKEDGNVRQLQADYTAAVTLVVNQWVAAKRAGTATTSAPVPDEAVLSAAAKIKSIAK